MGLEVEVVGESNKFDVIVIGGGIAGMVASSIITSNKLKACFLEKEVPGGKLMQIEQIHNSDKYANWRGIDLGPAIFNYAVEQVKTTYANGNVIGMKSRNDLFYLYTEDNLTWEAKAIIIATGTSVKKLNIDSASKFENKGLSYCVLCDAALAKNKKVVIIGNTLHIDHLKSFTNDITIIKENDVKEILGSDRVESIIKTDGTKVTCDMVFVQIGFETSNKFLIPEILKNVNGEIVVNNKMCTTMPGAFACGDCINEPIKLISKAEEQASIAAASAIQYVNSRKW